MRVALRRGGRVDKDNNLTDWEIKAMALAFQKMWDSHPSNLKPTPDDHPCKKKDGTSAFENQCAIRLGIALNGGGMNMKAYTKARCWYGHSTVHALRAQELADWLSLSAQLGKPIKFKAERGVDLKLTVLTAVNGKKGIVFCQDFWAPSPGGANVGDHIDLWDGTAMAHGSSSYFGPAKQVWFWEITT